MNKTSGTKTKKYSTIEKEYEAPIKKHNANGRRTGTYFVSNSVTFFMNFRLPVSSSPGIWDLATA